MKIKREILGMIAGGCIGLGAAVTAYAGPWEECIADCDEEAGYMGDFCTAMYPDPFDPRRADCLASAADVYAECKEDCGPESC